MSPPAENPTPPLEPGTSVEVRSRYDAQWKRGFEIAAIEDQLYRIYRQSDRSILGAAFRASDVRPVQ
jgi:hypothetical protein